MNEPTEHAQKTTGVVTVRMLLALIKGADRVYMHGKAAHDRASYSDAFVFTVTAQKGRGAGETRTTLDVPGSVANGNTSTRKVHRGEAGNQWTTFDGVFRPTRGFWSLFAAEERLRDVLEVLPADAEVSISVNLDSLTNEYMVRADCTMSHGIENGLHGDALYLEVRYMQRGKEKRRRYLLDTAVQPHNTARFGVGAQ